MAKKIDTTSPKFQAQEQEMKQFAKAYPKKAKAFGLVSGNQLKQEANGIIQNSRKDIKKNQKLIKKSPSDKELVEDCKRDINTESQKAQRSQKLISRTNPNFVYYGIKSGAYPEKSASIATSFEDLGPYKPKFVTRKNIMDQQPGGQFTKPDLIVKAFSKSGMQGVQRERHYLDHKVEIDNKSIEHAKANDRQVSNNNYGSYFNKVLHSDRSKEYGIVSGSDIKNAVAQRIRGIKAKSFDNLMNPNSNVNIQNVHKLYKQQVRPYKNISNRVLDNKAYDINAINDVTKTPSPITREDLKNRQRNKVNIYKKSGMTPPRTVKDTGAFIKSGYIGMRKYHEHQSELNNEKNKFVSSSQLNKDAKKQLGFDRNPKDRAILKELVHETNQAPELRVNLYDLRHGSLQSRLLDRSHLNQYIKKNPVAKEAMNHKPDFDKYDQAKQDEKIDAQADSEILQPHEAGAFSPIDSANNQEFYDSRIKPYKKAYNLYESNIKNHNYNSIVKQHKFNNIKRTMKQGVNVAPKSNDVTKSASSQLSRKPKFSKQPRKTQNRSANKRARLIAKRHKQDFHR